MRNAIDNYVAQCYNPYNESEVMKLINANKVKGRIVELGLTQKDVSAALGLAQPTINQKINNIRPMDLNEAEKLAELLKIKPEEFAAYFFWDELHYATTIR